MPFDVLLPSTLFFLSAVAVFLYSKLETKVKLILEEKKFSIRDVVMLVVVMGIAVTVLVFIPGEAIRILFLIFYSIALFLLTYIVVPKWYIGLLLPTAFLILYFAFLGALPTDMLVLIFMDVFAAIFVVFVSVYMGTLFGWETIAVFAGLLTVMDIIQVLVTGFMGESASKLLDLKLPVMIFVPTFPYQSHGIRLGLGDFVLSSLIATQTARKYGKKFGYISIAFIAAVTLIFEALMFYYNAGAMPATVFIDCGWLAALGVRYLYNLLIAKKIVGERQ
jgi:hypothetical protein